MKLKKKHFARLKEIAKETNENGVFGMTGIRLNTLITDIESVQKEKGPSWLKHAEPGVVYTGRKKEETITGESTYLVEFFKRMANYDYRKEAVKSLSDPKIGDVGYFSIGNPNAPIVYGRMRNFTGDNYQDTFGNWYRGFSKTPPELK